MTCSSVCMAPWIELSASGMSACGVCNICGMRSRRTGVNPYGWNCITYAAVVEKARSSSVGCSGNARRTRVRRSRHLPFYDPKVEGRQVTRV
ncbi:hypothetical protein CRG98_023512 [Punica granatum]|uniref:Uncharacterized protein n=1 Tax=Punica granatum TaxID=22663 RepID=A0A2I0JIK8_PUNGR|nr:hypothetical protein CRG98_023512 [Punica granatum]